MNKRHHISTVSGATAVVIALLLCACGSGSRDEDVDHVRRTADSLQALELQANGEGYLDAELYNDARISLEQALKLQGDALAPDHPDMTYTRYLYAIALDELGAFADAVEQYRMVMQTEERIGFADAADSASFTVTLAELASSLINDDRPAEAVAMYERAVAISQELPPGETDLGAILKNLGDACEELGQMERAVASWQRALPLIETDPEAYPESVVNARVALGRYYRDTRAFDEARPYYQGAVAWMDSHEVDPRTEADCLKSYAGLFSATGEHERALPLLERAVNAYERARTNTGGGIAGAAFTRSPYPQLAAVHLTRGNPLAAWEAIERFQGRLVAESVAASAQPGPGAIPADGIYTLGQIQTNLEEGTAIVSWLDVEEARGQFRSWAFVIRSHDSVRWIELTPGEAVSIDPGMRAATLRGALVNRRGAPEAAQAAANAFWRERMLPLSEALAGVERLIVVPAGAMVGIPVEALVDDGGMLFGDTFTVSYAPSASMWAWWNATTQPWDGARPQHALLIGDPLFRAAHLEQMVSQPDAPSQAVEVAVLRGALEGDTESIARLPRLAASRREVTRIAGCYGGRARILAGADASESSLMQFVEEASLSAFSVIHIATHALVDDRRPRRSRLVFSQVDANGARVSLDGVITAADIASQWQLDADLVVLSACETGLGRRLSGEGHVGFAQTLLQAGARRVVVSLWKVDDRASALLMERFHQHLTGVDPESGARLTAGAAAPATALAEAKRWLRNYRLPDGRRPFEHPRYWSAFILIGRGS